MAVGILGVLTVSGTTLIYYSSTNARSVSYSTANASAYDLAESGINEMMAILSKPHEQVLLSTDEPRPRRRALRRRDGEWSGTLTPRPRRLWSLTSIGTIANPTGATASQVTRTLTAQVPVVPTYTQPLNNPAWNFVFARAPGSDGCDMTTPTQRFWRFSPLRARQPLPEQQRERHVEPARRAGQLQLSNPNAASVPRRAWPPA